MAPKSKDGEVVFSISGKWIAWTHTVVAYAAFFGALIVGSYLHYYKIVENEYFVSIQEYLQAYSLIGPRVIRKNGFPPSPPPLAIDIQNVPSSSYLSP